MLVKCKCGSKLEFSAPDYEKYTINELLKSLDTFLTVHYQCYKEEWDEDRMDIIGQNGNEGIHYK